MPPERERAMPAAKRAFDIAGALALLAVSAPVGLVALAFIGLDSLLVPRDRGGLLHREPRVSAGAPFTLLKLRILTAGAQAEIAAGAVPKEVENRAGSLTLAGRALKRTGLDELPQLLNVLAGDMSLVGPRPKPRAEHDAALAAGEWWREELVAGLAGPVQAMKGTARTLDAQRAADEAYARVVLESSPGAVVAEDVRVLWRTLLAFLRFSGE